MRLLLLLLIANCAWGATGDVVAVRVIENTCAAGASCNGWVAEIDLEGLSTGGSYNFGLGSSNDPSAATVVFTVTSPGYTTSGSTTTIQRTVYATRFLRRPYPNEAVKDETAGTPLTVRVVLSDFIFSGDTATVTIASGFYTGSNAVTNLSVTNNSTMTHTKPIGRWAWVPYERVTGDFLLEFIAFHRSGMNGKPVAAVKFTCADENTNTVTATVNDMTVSTRTGDANKVLVYAATIPVSTLTQGDVVTCNAEAFPWVGDVTLNSDLVANGGDGFAQPNERIGPFAVFLDKTNSYGLPFAVVDPTNGQASVADTWVYSTQAAAESAYSSATTNSYNTISRAAQALRAYNNANNGHNDPGGGTILLVAASHVWPGSSGVENNAQDTWMTITRLSTVARADAVIASGTNSNIRVHRVKLHDITISGSSTGQVAGRAASDALWVDQCNINHTGNAGLYNWITAYATHNTITALNTGFIGYGSVKAPFALVRGNSFPSTSQTGGVLATAYAMIGNKNLRPRYVTTNYISQEASDNGIVAFNSFYNINTSWISGQAEAITHGFAMVQNLIENVANSDSSPTISFSYSSYPTANLLIWHNTIIGSRIIYAYNTEGSTSSLHAKHSFKNNIIHSYNCKTDTFPPEDGARTGNWAPFNGVGQAANLKRTTSGFWGDFEGLFTIEGGTMGFVAHKASTFLSEEPGDGAGNGDYRLTSTSSALNLVPSGGAVLPYDLDGVARRNDSTGAAGVYEYQEPSSQPRRRKITITD